MADELADVERRSEGGSTYELHRRRGPSEGGDAFDVVVDGQVTVRSAGARVDAELVDLALAPWQTRDELTVLLAGLGMGLTLRAVLDRAQVRQVDVVEHAQTMIDWAMGPLAQLNGGALADKRVKVHVGELGAFLREPGETEGNRRTGWFVVLLDTDKWPESLSRPENVEFYHEDFLVVLETALRPGGVLALASARRDDELERRLRARFQSVARIGVPVEVDGESRLYYVYRGRRSSVGGGDG